MGEFKDFIRYESQFGAKVVLQDLFALHRLAFQNRYLAEILNFAKDNGYRFTFFFSAKNLARHKKIVDRCKKEGHEIASHGYDHILYERLSNKDTEKEFQKAAISFKNHGLDPIGFRPPFLSTNKYLEKIAYKHGFKYISSQEGGKKETNILHQIPIVKPNDWYGICVKSYSFDKLMKEWKKKDGGVFLFHPWILRKQLLIIDKIAETKDLRIVQNLKNKITGVSFDVY